MKKCKLTEIAALAVLALIIVLPFNVYGDPTPCTGGSCESKAGNQLNCPTGGSLLCTATQCCKCKCIKDEEAGTTSTQNVCETCPTPKARLSVHENVVIYPDVE